jgi:tetratricopeptide (TPR) repeat protein
LRADARSRDREANGALAAAEKHLKGLRARLDDPIKVRELLSDIDEWQRLVDQAQRDLQRAKAASAGNEALVAEETRDRMQAVEAALEREEGAYGLARELDDIAVEALASADSRGSSQHKAGAEYERLFSRQGLDVRQPGTDWFASAIRSSPARFALLAALDNWAWNVGVNNVNERIQMLARQGVRDIRTLFCIGLPNDPQLARILELARAADPDPWRDHFRHPAVWADREALIKLANEIEVGQQSPTVLTSFGWWLQANGEDPTALYERSLLEHPPNFWLYLNAALLKRDLEARVGLFHAALAIRPRNALAYAMLASSLQELGDWPASLVAANRAITINPMFTLAYHYKGLALLHKKDLREAVAAFQRAIDLDPGNYLARHGLGQVLQQQGRYAEAEQAYLVAIQALHRWAPACDSLARLLATCPDEKIRDGKRAIEFATRACEWTAWKNPTYLDTLASAHAEAGQFEDAVRYQTRALEDPTLKGDFRTAAMQRLELYRQKKPFRDQGP